LYYTYIYIIGFIVEGCTQQQGTNKRQQQERQRVSGSGGGDRDSNNTQGSKREQRSRAEQSRAEQSRAEERKEQSRGRSYALCHGCEAAFRQRGQELHRIQHRERPLHLLRRACAKQRNEKRASFSAQGPFERLSRACLDNMTSFSRKKSARTHPNKKRRFFLGLFPWWSDAESLAHRGP
jgi:hypothetical protein